MAPWNVPNEDTAVTKLGSFKPGVKEEELLMMKEDMEQMQWK